MLYIKIDILVFFLSCLVIGGILEFGPFDKDYFYFDLFQKVVFAYLLVSQKERVKEGERVNLPSSGLAPQIALMTKVKPG